MAVRARCPLLAPSLGRPRARFAAFVPLLAALVVPSACAHHPTAPPAFERAARLPAPPNGPLEAVSAPAAPLSVASGAAPLTEPAVAAVSAGDIGEVGPLRLLAASPDASWVALCQGKPSSPRLVIGSGAGVPMDRLDAYDRSGRYLAVEQAGELVLVDASRGLQSALGKDVDLRRSREDFAPHRALAFDDQAQRFVYARGRAGATEIVVRDLASATERSFALGPGDLYRLDFDQGGRHVLLEVVRDDTSGNGRLDWPVPEERGSDACAPHPLAFHSYKGLGDTPRSLILELESGALREVPGFISTLGASFITRTFDGALWLEEGRTRQPLAPASCAGRVLFADADRKLVLVGCKAPKKPGRRELWLAGRGFPRNLLIDVADAELDRSAVSGVRLLPLYPGADSALLDLEKRELVPLAPGSRVLLTRGSEALIWRGDEVLRFDAEALRETQVAQGVLRIPQLLRAGLEAVLLSPFVLTLTGPVRLAPARPALALAPSGHVLVANARSESKAAPLAAPTLHEALEGPLRWQNATAVPDAGPLP